MFHLQPSLPLPTFLIHLLLAEFIVMNLRDYDNLEETGILHTLFQLSLEILFPFNTDIFLHKYGFASQCVLSAKQNNLPSFTQRDLKMRSQSPISSIQPPSSPCQQGVCSANSHTSS